ncbi:Unknown protein sequence [Pseudomonas amygdali pv. lachrymans]|nr:Unknown protein sequence [Pseudomonas amygdali pv. lachrymans]
MGLRKLQSRITVNRSNKKDGIVAITWVTKLVVVNITRSISHKNALWV